MSGAADKCWDKFHQRWNFNGRIVTVLEARYRDWPLYPPMIPDSIIKYQPVVTSEILYRALYGGWLHIFKPESRLARYLYPHRPRHLSARLKATWLERIRAWRKGRHESPNVRTASGSSKIQHDPR